MDTRSVALSAYYYGTYPLRVQGRSNAERRGQMPLCVLFYHRVADCHPNPWSISNAEFIRQMRWLKQNTDLVSLQEIQRRIREGHNDRVAVSITFDDGYAENCDRAVPFLIENEIPVTYFVSLDFVLTQRPFPQDVEAGVPLRPNTPEQLREMAQAGIEMGGHTRHHADIGGINSPEALYDEVIRAGRELGELVDQPIRYFAFPYGKPENMTAAAVELAQRQGLSGVCSAYGAYNLPGEDPFHIQRIHGDPEFIRLKNWITIDQRKMRHGRGFCFRDQGVTLDAIESLDD